MPEKRTSPLYWRIALALTLVCGLISGCDDPTCVFAGNCFAVPLLAEGALGGSAVEPIDGELIRTGDPTITESQPSGAGRSASTPIVLFFSESMAPDSVTSAFEVIDVFTMFPVLSSAFLLAEGRVLVILPSASLPAGDYTVRLVNGATLLDLGGAEVDFDASVDFAEFTVGATAVTKPVVVAVYPPDVSVGASSSPEIVCLFDRPMAAPINLMAGWDVMVRPAGSMVTAAPLFDPDPAPVMRPGFLGFTLPEPRVWTWQSLDGGDPARLETSAGVVSVSVSPVGARFTDSLDMGQFADESAFSFTLAAAPQPMFGTLNPGREPQDAIGIANLDGITVMNNLELQVDFEADDLAMDGDVLTVFMFGTDPTDAANTIAFSRSITLNPGMAVMSASILLPDLDLTSTTAPLAARFADGLVRFAMRLERGGEEGYLRLLDVDMVADGTQDPVLDTVRPELILLDGQMVDTDTFASDQTDLVVVGHADVDAGDFIRGAEVTTAGMGDNITTPGVIPEVLGSADSVIDDGMGPMLSSFFIAAPVTIGRLTPNTAAFNATVTVYDQALNASTTSLVVPFVQRGAVGSNPINPADMNPLIVEVYNSETLLPVQAALVYSHAEVDDGFGNLTYPMLSAGGLPTDVNGIVNTLPHHNAAQVSTLVTVVAAGFDVFTFHGLPTDRLSIPLSPVQQIFAAETNSLLVDPSVDLSTFARRVGDTRRIDLVFPTEMSSSAPGGTSFDFNTTLLRPFRYGAQTLTAGIIDANPLNASKDRLVKAFEIRVPVDGQEQAVNFSAGAFSVSQLLDDAAAPISNIAKAVADVGVTATGIVGMDPTNLVNDADYARQPLVMVEATMAGIDRPLSVGMGTAYDVMADPMSWDLRSAYAGAVDPTTGSLASVLDADLHLRVELREEDGTTMLPLAVSGMRPAIAQLGALDPLVMPDVPVVTSMATDGTGVLVTPGFNLTFDDAIDNGSGLTLDGRGLYRVVITELLMGVPGRRWELYKLDATGAASTSVHFPDLGPDPVPLQTGGATSAVQVSSFAWEAFPTFAPTETLLWSDIGREVESYAHTEIVPFLLQ